jgi:hypothetical protein
MALGKTPAMINFMCQLCQNSDETVFQMVLCIFLMKLTLKLVDFE